MNEPQFIYKVESKESKEKQYVYEVVMVSKDDDDFSWNKGIYQNKKDAKKRKKKLKKKKPYMYFYIQKTKLN